MKSERTVRQNTTEPNGLDENGGSGYNSATPLQSVWSLLLFALTVILIFLNYFLSQYDKFILSYFQPEVIHSLHLTSTQYGVLSGYATGILYALMAIPMAFVADYTGARVWTLSLSALWWSLCVLFQGYSHNFWQILLARMGMGIGQAPVEALSVSLISDLVPGRWLFLSESFFYVGVYVGEAISGQIAHAFSQTNTPWNDALKAMGIVGMVLSVLIRLVVREPVRKDLLQVVLSDGSSSGQTPDTVLSTTPRQKARQVFMLSVRHVVCLKSFWILTLAAGARQFSGNVFGYYMPSYLTLTYPDESNLLSNYGIIVGTVGSAAVIVGGLICSFYAKHLPTALWLTAVGGMLSSIFVILMVFSNSIADGDEAAGVRILYGVMSAAYVTAELWLGAFASLLAALFPPRTKTFCLAIYTCTIILIYSSAPQIIGLSLRSYEVGSRPYVLKTRDILAILIPVGYWVAALGFLLAVPKVKEDFRAVKHNIGHQDELGLPLIGRQRKFAFTAFIVGLVCLTIGLFVTSLVVT